MKDPINLLPFVENNPKPKRDLRLEAEKFIRENPRVYQLFEKLALARRRNFGIGQLTEVVRWEIDRTWDVDDRGFKINNNHRAYIARQLIEDHPELADRIQCRRTFW